MLANHDPSASRGAMLLFLTNFLAILVAGGGLFAIMGYGRVAFRGHLRGRRAAAIVVAVAMLLIAIPLGITGASVAQDTKVEYDIRTQAESTLKGTGVQLAGVDAHGSTVEVVLEGPVGKSAAVARRVAEDIHTAKPDLDVHVSLVQSEIVNIPGR
jgi:hypothetical protein